MNIKKKVTKIEPLFESRSNLTLKDLYAYLDRQFPDNAKSWRQATDEIVDIANYVYEEVKQTVSESVAEKIADTVRSKTPSERNMRHKARIKEGVKNLSKIGIDALLNYFAEWIMKDKKLFESQQFQDITPDIEIGIDSNDDIKEVMTNKQYQFVFDSGVFMANIHSNIKNKFGLIWHLENTNSLDSFIDSVGNFMITTTKNEPTSGDVERLKAVYEKYIKSHK